MSSLYVCRNGLDGSSTMKSNSNQPVMDKAKEWQMELLMEKLRSKSGQYKSFSDSAKMLRMALLEKRYPVDGVERIQLQKCLDTLQNSIRVTTLSGMVERLESVSRQLGLKFMTSGGAGLEWFISSDMFYVEVVLEPSGDVKDVKIHHEGKQERQSCEELVSCLQQQDFGDFAAQLEGLASIYQLNAEKAVKCNALNALQSLEADLTTLSALHSMDAQSMLCKSPVGILQKRRGGHAMRLTYWVSPYDLLDQKSMSEVAMTVEQVNKRSLGYSVSVCMEASTAHKLQISPLVTTQRGVNGDNVPVYSSLQAQNSATLPACFALRLHEPLPLCVTLARRIQQVTDMECGDLTTPHPLLSLITQHASRGQLDCANNNGLYVNLPDQTHCYRMTESKGLEAVMVNSIPFTHPKQVPHILGLLRQQAVFNCLVSSCIRINSRHDFHVTLLEVTALSWQHLSVSLEHPQEESMTTVEIDLSDPTNIKCNLFGAGSSSGQSVTPEFAAKVLQRCMSIPVTMRSLMKCWQNQKSLTNGLTNGNGNFNLPLGSGGGGTGGGGHHDDSGRHGMSDFNNLRDPHIKMEPHDNSSNDMTDSVSGFPSFNSPLLGDMAIASPMSSFGPGSSMMTQSKEPVVINLMSEAVPKKKQRKRKVMENLWRSPKHKSDECEILVESSSNESTPHGTPTSRDAPADFRIPTPTSIEFPHLMDEGKQDMTSSDKGHSELEGMSVEDVMEIQEMDSVEEMLKAVSARKIKKPREERKSPSSIQMLDIDGKSMVPPSVSITPINTSSSSSLPSNLNSVLSGMGLERRPGIEIIPIGSTPPASLPSTITITPIPPSKSMSDDRSRDRKSREKARSEEEEKMRLEKKRKRKREDSPMGPPEKLPPKQDPLSKPVSVSIKPTDSPPMSMSRPSSPAGTLRKFSTSPTHTSPLALMSKSASSPGGMGKSSKPSPTQQSPKHSPAYSTSSPKHNPIPSSASPKHHGTSSPKHTSGSSGKPSMSTLKSAASSPSSGKSSGSDPMKVKPPSSSKDGGGNRDKDRSRISSSLLSVSGSGNSGGSGSNSSNSSGGGGGSGGSSSISSSGHQSPKLKSSSVKMKQPDFNIGSDTTVTPILPPPPSSVSSSSTSPSSSQDCKQSTSSALPQIRNRKNSLSAVIDKLTHKHNTGDEIAVTVTSGGISASISGSGGGSGQSTMMGNDPSGNGGRDRIPTPTKGPELKSLSSSGKPGDSGKNPGEYMVKPGSEGIKLTINKTRTKDPSSKSLSSSSSSSPSNMMKSSSQSGSGSPKLHSGHTGLKPGVNSGPASKKPQTSSSSSSSSSPSLPKIPSSSGNVSGNSTSSSGLKSTSNPSSSKPPSSSVTSSSSSSSSSSTIAKSSSSSSSSGSSKSLSKSSGSPKLGSSSSSSDPNRNRDGNKPRPPKSSSSGSSSSGGSSSSDKALFSSSKERKSSPAPPRDEDSDRTFKAITSKMDAPFGLEGFVKQLDTKFQIPKLSARSNNPDSDQSKKTTPEKSDSSVSSRSVDVSKALDLVSKPEPKYSTSSPVPSTSPALPTSVCAPGMTVVLPPKAEEKSNSSQIEQKPSKPPSASGTPIHSASPSPRLTPSPLPKLETKTPTDGSPIPGLTITPIVNIPSIGGGGGSSSNDSMDLSIDLSRPPSETKCKSEPQRGSLSIVPSSSKEDLVMRSGSPAELKAEKLREFAMSGDKTKKLILDTPLLRMEEIRSTPPSGSSSQDSTEVLLDFSGSKVTPPEPSVRKMTVTERMMAALPSRRNTTPPPMFPASPSVTMHIVKSPSSLLIPSPQAGSPCITDDDLMDEALVGMGK